MNLFETVKASVSVPEAARAYGLTVTRHNMTRCLFHDDRHPSLKLNPDFYYCFGCGAKGDVIDLVAGLFDLSLYEAARKIAENFGIDPDNPPKVAALAKPRHPMIRAFRDDERYCQRVLCDYLHLLENWKVQYAPTSMEEEPDMSNSEKLYHSLIQRKRNGRTTRESLTYSKTTVNTLFRRFKRNFLDNTFSAEMSLKH